jgi:hypothetical protein
VIETIEPVDIARSRLATRVLVENAPNVIQEVSLCTIESADKRARSWRVSFGRLERRDENAALVDNPAIANSAVAVFPSINFAYSAGAMRLPSNPPRRVNPVMGTLGPGNFFRATVYVELAWGMGDTAPDRMLADWPAQGGSIVVYGKSVHVYAAILTPTGATTEELPITKATVIPTDGLSTEDGGELSLVQQDTVRATRGAAFYVPDFARRVKLVGVQLQPDGTYRVPFAGEPGLQACWFDDLGNTIDAWLQGGTTNDDDDWHAVPGRAVMLGVYKNPDDPAAETAMVHWRLGP